MRRAGGLIGTALAVIGAAATVAFSVRAARSWRARVAVEGHSMEPTLHDGDWLIVDPDSYRRLPPLPGELVVVRDPRRAERLLVKRVERVRDGALWVAGDHGAHRGDADVIGSVPPDHVVGRPWLRYWPPRRFGLIARARHDIATQPQE